VRRLLPACAVMLLALAACGPALPGSTGSAHGTTSDSKDAARAFAQCMRANGLTDYPDPDPNGRSGAGHEAFDPNDPRVKAASDRCRSQLPGGGEHAAPNPETIRQLVAFAQCMRANGVADFPDPNADGSFPRSAEEGAHNDPKFQAASDRCRKNLPQHGGQ
jgi:hypothetical protein